MADARAIRPSGPAFRADLPRVSPSVRFNRNGADFVGPDGEADLFSARLAAWGRRDVLIGLQPVEPKLGECVPGVERTNRCTRQLQYQAGALTEWWVGLDSGVEQGWTIAVAPTGAGPLVFHVVIEGADGVSDNPLVVIDAAHRTWTVDGLRAWDAAGRTLPIRVRVAMGGYTVEVDDAGASYPITVDPTYSTADWAWVGGGSSLATVAAAGDVNGDGLNDFAIGEPGFGENTGRVYVFMGTGDGVEATPSTTLDGRDIGELFGSALAGAGDVNHDGYDDLIVGAYARQDLAGAASVYLGSSAGLTTTPATTLDGAPGDGFGAAVAGAGDVDGDGYADVAIGTGAGNVAYLYGGSLSGLAETPTTTLNGVEADSNFGTSVAGVGDVNRDGYDDVIVGAPEVYYGYGAAYVYQGSASGVAKDPASTLDLCGSGRWFGYAVAGAGDVDADGYADVIVGNESYGDYLGTACIFRGGSSGVDGTAVTTLETSAYGDCFGCAVAGVGDVNGDGFEDVSVGADGRGSDHPYDDGIVRIYLGSASGIDTAPVASLHEPGGFGASLVGAGDVNSDGYADFLVGGRGYVLNIGGAALYAGSATGIGSSAALAAWESPGPIVETPLVSATGDVNGDGYADFAVASGTAVDHRGVVYLFDGGPAGPADAATTTLTGAAEDTWLGFAMSSAGDVDADGYDDVLIESFDPTSRLARVDLHHGAPSGLDTGAPTTLVQTDVPHNMGISPIGDANADGNDDVLVIEYGMLDDNGVGRVYHGSAGGLATTPATTLLPDAEDGAFGGAASAGDFDAEGHDDIAVGARKAADRSGIVSVYLGGPDGISSASDRVLAPTRGAYYGDALAAADFNGDGYADLAVQYYAGDDVVGVDVYAGGPDGIGPASATKWTRDSSNLTGSRLAGVEDADGDGFDELACGDAVGDDEILGTVLIYAGSAAGLITTPAVEISLLTTRGNGIGIGRSVAGLGDVNGDGFGDLLVGANDRALLYYGGKIEVGPGDSGTSDSGTGDSGGLDSATPETPESAGADSEGSGEKAPGANAACDSGCATTASTSASLTWFVVLVAAVRRHRGRDRADGRAA